MTKKHKETLQLAVRSSIHMVIQNNNRSRNVGFGTGVAIHFADRFFFCTVEHNVEQNKNKLAILTGERDGAMALTVQPLDIAITEVQEIQFIQEEQGVQLDDGSVLIIESGKKHIVDIDQLHKIEKNARYSFYGRIKSNIGPNGEYSYTEKIVKNLKYMDMDDHLIRFDLGRPIGDHCEFEGCSGAPIIDQFGNLIALLKGGDKNVDSTFIYGFRLDETKRLIKMTYFNPSLDVAIKSPPNT